MFCDCPLPYGSITGGGECFGHSLIIDPWGNVLADGGEGERVVLAEIDMELVSQARRKIPALVHDRDFVPQKHDLAAE